jgi:acyl dehydratase
MPGEVQKSRFYEDVEVGQEITALVKGPMTTLHLMRWSAAIENWHRIHYDRPFAVEHDKLPDVLVAGSWKQQALVQMLKDWCGEAGWLWKITYQFRAMDLVGATLTCWGRVTNTYVRGGLGFVECDIGMRNQAGEETTPGTAVAVLPRRGGKPVPYPFVMPEPD